MLELGLDLGLPPCGLDNVTAVSSAKAVAVDRDEMNELLSCIVNSLKRQRCGVQQQQQQQRRSCLFTFYRGTK